MLPTFDRNLNRIAELLRSARYAIAMTGAGMSVESGIPPFRGTGGLWTKYGNPSMDGYSEFRKDPVAWWHRRSNEKIDAHIMELREALAAAASGLTFYREPYLREKRKNEPRRRKFPMNPH